MSSDNPNKGQDGGQQGGQNGKDKPPEPPTFEQVRAQFPEDIRGDKSLDQIKTVADLGKSYVNAQQLIGRKQEEYMDVSKPETKALMQKALGRPDTSEGYGVDFEALKQVPGYDEAYVKELLNVSHSLGVSKEQLAGLVGFQTEQIKFAIDRADEHRNRTMEELRGVWGGATERNVALASRAVERLGGDELVKYFDEGGLGNEPLLVKAFARMGIMMAENGIIEAEVSGMPTIEGVKAEVDDIMYNKENPLNAAYLDNMHPRHKEAVDKVTKLHQMMYPEV